MAMLPLALAFLSFILIIAGILFVINLISKIGMAVLSARMGIRLYGLLFIPIVGQWYEGIILAKLLNKKAVFKIIYFFFKILPVILWFLMLLIEKTVGYMDFEEIMFDVFCADIVIMYVVSAVLKIISMLRAGVSLALSLVIGIIVPDFWCYTMLSKKFDK